MLCTRCHQREARPIGSREGRAKCEEQLGVPLPFPEDLCKECFTEWFKSPEGKAQMKPFERAVEERFRKDVERWKQDVRSAALKVLDVADAIAGKF